jgi:hypothetical protein
MQSTFRLRSILLLSPLLLLAPGCNDLVPGTDDNLSTRYEAASQITNPVLADAKLSKVAQDAAFVGNEEISTEAVDRIGDISLRNKTAYQSALWLARNGDRDSAIALAQKISDGRMRDQLLDKLSNAFAP